MSLGSSGCASVRKALDRICRSEAPLCSTCGGVKTVLYTFWGGPLAKMEVHTSPGIGNLFAAMAACYVYECILGTSLSI
jgi:hypothetical protein